MWGSANKTYLAIHGCEIDLAASRIKGLKGWIQLKPKSMEVLEYLLDHPLKVCTREEILNAVWGRSIVSDDVLSQAISELRKAFNDDFHSPSVLETIPRRGYRLLLEPISRKTSYRVWLWPVIFAMAIIAIFLVYLNTTRPQELARQTIAVLPFVNMSDDAANEYFSDGISEELLNLLAQIPELRVISRHSAFYFKGKDVNLVDVTRELNVTHILEGSVRKAGNQVRITAQLIEARTDTHLWSETYDRELENIFDVQDEISKAIVGALKESLNIHLETSPKTITATNPEAHDAYMRGRYLVVRRTTTTIEAAVSEFEKAITLDPDYALAHAELAIAYLLLSYYGDLTTGEAIAKSMPHIDRAMVLDSNLAEAYAANGLLLSAQENWEDSLTYLNQAIRINPNYAIAHLWKGTPLELMGRYEEAFLANEAALRLNPLSIITIANYQRQLTIKNQLDKAEQELEKIALIYPGWYLALRGGLTSVGGNWANLVLGYLDVMGIKWSRDVSVNLSRGFAFIGLEQEALSISETASILWILGRPDDAVRAMEEHLGENPAPDVMSRGLVAGNTVTNFKAGVATNQIASGMLLADNALSSTFADIVVGNGFATPRLTLPNGEHVFFDTPFCPPSEGNAVLAEADDVVVGNVDNDSNIIVRRDDLGALSGPIEEQIAAIYERVEQGGALDVVFEDLFATYEELFDLLHQAQ